MEWKKIAIACICLYLAIALPVHVINQEAVEECSNACLEKGFDIVVSATGFGENIQCRCFDSMIREETFVSVGQKNR